MGTLGFIGRRLAIVPAALLVMAIPAALTATTAAGAATCSPTDFSRDEHILTAAQIGGSVSGTLDATDCDIGVYFKTPGSVTQGAQIFGARYFGVVNNGTAVTVRGANIHDIGNIPFDGAQHGVGIYFTNGGSGAIDAGSGLIKRAVSS